MATCSAQSLLESGKCFQCLTKKEIQVVIAQLLCQIAEAPGGGSQSPWTSDIDGGCFNLNNVCKFNGIKRYRALLNQSGTDAPVAEILENTLGADPVFSYVSIGRYELTLANAFPLLKTMSFISYNWSIGDSDLAYSAAKDQNTMLIRTFDITGQPLTAGEMGSGNHSLEILVYPEIPQCPNCL